MLQHAFHQRDQTIKEKMQRGTDRRMAGRLSRWLVWDVRSTKVLNVQTRDSDNE